MTLMALDLLTIRSADEFPSSKLFSSLFYINKYLLALHCTKKHFLAHLRPTIRLSVYVIRVCVESTLADFRRIPATPMAAAAENLIFFFHRKIKRNNNKLYRELN